MTAIARLATFIAGIDPVDIDPALLAKMKDHTLDTLGVAVAGSGDACIGSVAEVIFRWGGAAEARAICHNGRLPAPKAAYLNALQARILTFDDTFDAGPVHPGSVVVAAALAVAERDGANGPTLLAGMLAGYEVMTRVATALGPDHYRRGFHATGSCAPFGAAAAAARTSGLNPEATAGALALAGGAAIGFRQYQEDGSLLDSAFNAARGAETGVVAADFAARGISGPLGILDGRWGALRMLSDAPDPDALVERLGQNWLCATTSLKPYASCRFVHGPVAALRASRVPADAVESIDITTFRESFEVCNRPDPQSISEAILSHQLAAALALSGRALIPSDYANVDPAVRDLASRVHVAHDPALDALLPGLWPHRMTLHLKSGQTLQLAADQRPVATSAEARSKFASLVIPSLGANRAAQLIECVSDLSTLTTVRQLTALLRPVLRETA